MVQAFVGIVVAFAWLGPMILAPRFVDTLDLSPYFECFGVGVVLGIATFFTLRALVRRGSAGFGSSRIQNWALVAVAFAPPWTVALGLGANRWLDHSPALEHVTRVLAWEVHVKSRARCRVTSWRGLDSEVVTDDLVASAGGTTPVGFAGAVTSEGWVRVRAAPDSKMVDWNYPRACVPKTSLVIASHSGTLGWEWIEKIRVP